MKKNLVGLISIFLVVLFATLAIIRIKEEENNGLKKITVAEVAHSVFYAPQYVAHGLGYFEEEGLDVSIVLTSGADNVMAAVLSGDADIGFSGSEATIYVYNGGEKDYVMTFAGLTQKDGSFLVSREKYDNFTLNDLKGKRVIGGRVAGMPEMTFEWALRENGIDPKNDLEIDTSVAFPAMEGSFIGGNGDFVSLFEPLATKIENEGYGYVVKSLGSLSGNVPYTAFNARTSFINDNKELIKSFANAIQKGLDFVNNNDSKVIAEKILSKFPDTSLNDLEKSIKRYKENDTWPTTYTFTKESFDNLQNIVREAGFIKENVSYEDLIYQVK